MYSQIAANKRRSVVIILGFLVLIGVIAWFLSRYLSNNNSIFYIVLGCAALYAIITYFVASRMALAVNGAKEITQKDNPRLWRIIENLSITDGLPMPRVFIINDPAPNAFATGPRPDKAIVCATTGLLEIMTDTELQGVFAHELGHVKNYDIRVSMVVFALVAVVALLTDVIIRFTFFGVGDRRRQNSGQAGVIILVVGLVAAILAPIVATLIQLAISRQREYLADATGALTTRYPEGLISALQKIDKTGSALKKQNTATAHFFFANPLKGHSITNLFSTHPPIKDRIARLKNTETHA
jgi:heat shock protein HtpX